jgi:hypothetical protein
MLEMLTRSGRGRRAPRADVVAPVADFLQGDPGDVVVLPMLPQAGTGMAAIEFAAASVVERIVLGAMVRRERPARIFEIGTFRGVTALSMAANFTWDAELYTLDLPPELSPDAVNESHYEGSSKSGFRRLADAGVGRNVGAALRGYSGPCRVQQLFGDVATFDFEPYSDVGLFFVDGCHTFEAARRDSEIAFGRARRGGLVVWHDYTREGVERAVRATCSGMPVTWIEGTTLAFARKA